MHIDKEFLSTPSARRATGETWQMLSRRLWNFYPRPPRGGRLHAPGEQHIDRIISIHALREEGDRRLQDKRHKPCISIHALREEGDSTKSPVLPPIAYFYPRPPRGGRPRRPLRMQNLSDFYPRPPRGGRPSASKRSIRRARFLSTPSARRATRAKALLCWTLAFLSTPSARRATPCGLRSPSKLMYFYPRPPRGGRRLIDESEVPVDAISIHALREEGDSPPPVQAEG